MQCSRWFLQEQREEVASMTELLAAVERGKDTSSRSRST
jgi:ferritin